MWNLPGPGIKPTSPALVGTTGPPGKSKKGFLSRSYMWSLWTILWLLQAVREEGKEMPIIFHLELRTVEWNSCRQGRMRLRTHWDYWEGTKELYRVNSSITAAAAKSLQSCLTLCDPIDGSPPGSPVPGILQARTLEWVVISFSNAWKWKVKVKSLSCVRPSVTPWTAAFQAPPSMGFSRQEYWSGVPLPSLLLAECKNYCTGLRYNCLELEEWNYLRGMASSEETRKRR